MSPRPGPWPTTNADRGSLLRLNGEIMATLGKRGDLHTTFTDDKDKELVVMWLAGETLTSIATKLHWPVKTTSTRRRRLGLPARIQFTEWTPERDATLRDRLAKRFSFREIAKELGVNRGSISGRAFRLGLCASHGTVDPRPRIKRERKLSPEFQAQLTALWADMVPADEVGKRLGLHAKTVFNYVARLGLKRPRVVQNRSASSRRTAPGRAPSAVLALPDPDYADCLTLEQVKGTCHWPLGEPTKFCPRKACDISHGSYCEQHYARSIQRRTASSTLPFYLRRAA
jgi:hypothetical protein